MPWVYSGLTEEKHQFSLRGRGSGQTIIMIKAVFFDLYGTLAHYDPPRHQLHVTAARQAGIEVSPEAVRLALPPADKFWGREIARRGMEQRSEEEGLALYDAYEHELLQAAGVNVSLETAARVMAEFRKFALNFTLFEDSLPALRKLKELSLTLGMLSNITRDINKLCQKLGLTPYLDIALTSRDVGADKPQPPIFLAALDRARVEASQAMYVGDQYDIDVLGARGAGIEPVLLDRDNRWPTITDCPKIQSLTQIERLL